MESLVKFKDMLPGIQSGMTDLGWLNATYHPSNLRNMIILDNPGNFGQNYAAALLAIIDAMENEPTLRGEMERENIVLLSSHISGISQIAAKKCFDSIKGIKGQTIRTYGGVEQNTWNTWGKSGLPFLCRDLRSHGQGNYFSLRSCNEHECRLQAPRSG